MPLPKGDGIPLFYPLSLWERARERAIFESKLV
jgi:hypothetical protein